MNSIIINGIKIYDFSSREALIEYAFAEKKSLIAINAGKILNADNRMREMVNENIGFGDGIGAVWALKKNGLKNALKIPGCELWLDVIRSSYHVKSFYLVGGIQDVIEQTVVKLKEEFPGIRIVNFRNGYISGEDEKKSMLDDIKTRKPDVVFVAMGSPKQELLIDEMLHIHPAVYQGLGGSFDVYAGLVNRAPEWWINHNLEGVYRVIKQPRKLKRFVKELSFYWRLFTGIYK